MNSSGGVLGALAEARQELEAARHCVNPFQQAKAAGEALDKMLDAIEWLVMNTAKKGEA